MITWNATSPNPSSDERRRKRFQLLFKSTYLVRRNSVSDSESIAGKFSKRVDPRKPTLSKILEGDSTAKAFKIPSEFGRRAAFGSK
jgi:hypothetical protein